MKLLIRNVCVQLYQHSQLTTAGQLTTPSRPPPGNHPPAECVHARDHSTMRHNTQPRRARLGICPDCGARHEYEPDEAGCQCGGDLVTIHWLGLDQYRLADTDAVADYGINAVTALRGNLDAGVCHRVTLDAADHVTIDAADLTDDDWEYIGVATDHADDLRFAYGVYAHAPSNSWATKLLAGTTHGEPANA